MSENLHEIDDLFKKAIGQHNETPSPNVWDAIDKNLDKKKVVSISKKYNKLKWAAAALLLFSFGMAMYTLQTRLKNRELVKQNNINNSSKKSEENITSDEKKTTGSQVAIPQRPESKEYKKNEQIIPGNTQSATNIVKKKNQPLDYSNQTPAILHKEDTAQNINAKQNKSHSQEPVKISKEDSAENNNAVSTHNGAAKKSHLVEKQNEDKPGKAGRNMIFTIDGKEKINDAGIDPPAKYMSGVPLIFTRRQWQNTLQVSPSNTFLYKTTVLSNPNPELKNITAKKTITKRAKPSLFYASAFISPEFVSFNIDDDHPRYREDDRNKIKNHEKPGSSLTYGLSLGYNAGKRWVLESGVSVFSGVTNINTETIYARPDDRGNVNYRLSCSAGSAFVPSKTGYLSPGDSTKILSAKNRLQYISIPFLVKYAIGKGKLTVVPGVGISANILSKGDIETVLLTTAGDDSYANNKIDGLKSAFFNTQLSIGAVYNFSKKFALTFTPAAKLALTSINNDEAVKTKLNSFGLATGITIKL